MNIREVLRYVPLLRVFVPLAAGIVVHQNLPFFIGNSYWIVIPFIFLFITHWFEQKVKHAEGLFAFAMIIFFFSAGYFLWERDNDPRLFHYSKGKSLCILRIDDQPMLREHGFRCPATIIKISDNDTLALQNEQLMAWFADSSGNVPSAGSLVIADVSLSLVEPPINKGEFDYKAYLKRNGIVRQGYIKSWKLVDSVPAVTNGLMPLLMQLRHNMSLCFKQAGLTGDRLGVASALVLGDRNFLSADIQGAYSRSGVMHILAVSGMHVAMLYGFLLVLLGFMSKSSTGSMLQSVIILIVVWAYSCLTGLSPSVLRSAVMFTFILVGKMNDRNSESINSLATSAVFLLLINSNLIFDIGFQLSYLAVAGIIVFYSSIYKLYYTKNKVLNFFWKMVAVSIAAQLTTTPLALYYFHQFPNLFILANLVAIPLSNMVMLAALVLLLFSFWHWASYYIAIVLGYSLDLLNGSVRFIEQLPGSVSQHIWLTQIGLVLLYALLMCGAMYYFSRKRFWLFSFLFLLIFVCFERSYVQLDRKLNNEVVYFSVKNEVVTAFSVNGYNYLITSLDSSMVSQKLYSQTKNYWALRGGYPIVIQLNKKFIDRNLVVHAISESASLVNCVGKSFLINKPNYELDSSNIAKYQLYTTSFLKINKNKSSFQTAYRKIKIP